MPYRSNIQGARAAMLRAIDAGLVSAASVYQGAMKKRLGQGYPHTPHAPTYTPGKYVTGHSARSVVVVEPRWEGTTRMIAIGTNLMYNLYWELGFHHAWSGVFYRSEVWMPTLLEMRDELRDVFVRAAQSAFGGGSVPPIANEVAE